MIEAGMRMRDIPIRNKELLGILDNYVKLRTDDQESFDRWSYKTCKNDIMEDWTSEEYLREVISQGLDHEGFPDSMKGYEFRLNKKEHMFFNNEFAESAEEGLYRTKFIKTLAEINHQMWNFMGCRNQALTAMYPPGGYIAWHNNANAAAWNFIFTYSETGEGHFKYWDIEKQEIVYMHDKPGWQCKAGYFGRYDEPENVFYHAAETKCWRQTVSFCFDTSQLSGEYREEIIDEISSE
jgi:hypothetical protein